MKGITFLEDTTHNKKLVQIDLAVLKNNDDEYIQDVLDAIIAESRKDEKEFSLQ
jgi:hypothetical protein